MRRNALRLLRPAILRVDDWQAFEEQRLALFDTRTGLHEHALLERLSNRLGEQRVRGLCCLADHRPERAWQWCPPDAQGDPSTANGSARTQPPWLLANPRPLRTYDGVPVYGGMLQLESFPERIEAGWWDGFDITRDYFVAHSPAGERLWVFRDRRGGGWYLHGLFI
jgi:protein ImuB